MELVFTEYLLKNQKTPLIHRMKFKKGQGPGSRGTSGETASAERFRER